MTPRVSGPMTAAPGTLRANPSRPVSAGDARPVAESPQPALATSAVVILGYD
ncbi:hypothetical protein [Microbacterium thalassium]|uniref:Uncharacterized protein n=1 Tax=Microbacterium thalassium TaxID=362649 RepID=A0A7X0FP39_9MICO|nr:hypothetical protein [Microbacterium thalassium]MBB6391088.1 hypothetical protein [Microbacterium thalassium]